MELFLHIKMYWALNNLQWLICHKTTPLTYLGSNISSTNNDVNTLIGKAWIAIDRLVAI